MGHEYIKESETFSTSKNGTVPKPTAQEVSDGKVLSANGTWVANSGGGGGSSTLAGLSDVNLSTLENGDGLIYDEASEIWKNAPHPYPPLIYSTEEREIGVWADGKPLYQKTVILQNITINSNDLTTVTLSDYFSNVDNVVDYVCTDGSEVLPKIFANSSYSPYSISAFVEKGGNILCFSRGSGGAVTLTFYCTLCYTKTTDTAGSGSWTTKGTPTHHYSQTEQIIGTWIDGKPLYEKTVYLSSLSYDTNWHSVAHNISNIERIVNCSCAGVNNSDEFFVMPNYRPTLTQGIVITVSKTNINYMNNWQNDTPLDAYITLRYTKTTD